MLAARMIDKPILRTAIMLVIDSRCLRPECVLFDLPSTISRFCSVVMRIDSSLPRLLLFDAAGPGSHHPAVGKRNGVLYHHDIHTVSGRALSYLSSINSSYQRLLPAANA